MLHSDSESGGWPNGGSPGRAHPCVNLALG